MTQITLSAVATHRSTVEISGTKHGPFLIHKDDTARFYQGDEFPSCRWNVSHIGTTCRFPWSFATKRQAIAFCKQVEPIMDWSSIAVGEPKNAGGQVSEWTAGKPTEEQITRVRDAAHAHGGKIR